MTHLFIKVEIKFSKVTFGIFKSSGLEFMSDCQVELLLVNSE